jgi:hypothetical protein
MKSGDEQTTGGPSAGAADTTPGIAAGAATGSSQGPAQPAGTAGSSTEESTTRRTPLADLISFQLPKSAYTGRTAKGRARRN